jgi:oligopeptide transport system substrate-binding protein
MMGKRRGRWVTIVLLVLAALMPTTGSLVSTEAQDTAESKVLRVHQLTYPEIIDPQKSSFSTEIGVLVTIYEGLTRLDSNLQTVPAAAERWESNADGTVWTFTLHDGLTYSDGSPLTAERFRYAIERTCDPNTAGDYQYLLFDIVGCAEWATLPASDDNAAYEAAKSALGVRARDDRTLEITLAHPAPYFPSIASLWVFFPVKQEFVEQFGDAWWTDVANHVGNGPFQLSQMEQDQVISFEANDRYWAGPPQLDGIDYVYVPEAAVALEAYRAGDLDIAEIDPSQIPVIESDPVLSAEMVRYPTADTAMLSFNLRQEPFTDMKVREAFAYGFDRETFCNFILSGGCVPWLSWVPEGVPGFIDTDSYAFDPERARQALAESSYGGPEDLPEITYSFSADIPEERPRAEWIASQYRDVLGIEITLEPVDDQTLISRLSDPENFPQMVLLNWVQDYPDPQNWLSLLWTCEGLFATVSGYCSENFDALVAEGDTTLEMADRVPLYEEAGQVLLTDLPGVFICSSAKTFLVKPEVTGYAATPVDLEWPGLFTSLATVDLSQ